MSAAFNDDSLNLVASPSQSGARANTPNKVVRSITPLRSHSATKSAAKAIAESIRSVSRSTSRRRLRMWENQNLIGTALISQNLSTDDDEEDDEDIDQSINLHFHFRSAFYDILQLENEDARRAYLSCQSREMRTSKSTRKSSAERAWLGVEKKLRDIVISVCAKQNMIEFLRSVELILLYYQMNATHPPDTHIPDSFMHHLKKPLSSSKSSLIVCLIDSPFHRLFLHAASQYHGLLSKSITAEDGSRITNISMKKTPAVNHGVSLTCFLNFNKIDEFYSAL